MTIQFIDLKSQYRAMREPIDCRIQQVLVALNSLSGQKFGRWRFGSKPMLKRAAASVSLRGSMLYYCAHGIGIRKRDEVVKIPYWRF